MFVQPIDYFLVVWFVLAALSTAYVAWDQLRHNPEPLVMKWGFILVTLYLGPLGLLLYVMADGASAEIAVVGFEGILGISLFMGGNTTPSRAVVRSAGHGYRLKAELLQQEFNRAGPVLRLLLRYTQALITQMTQTAVCNRHHSVEQQLCRALWVSLDRLSSNSLTMTQELIANMLGVRREGVTEAAGNLQRAI